MLPFLEPKKLSGIIIARRGKPDLEVKSETSQDANPESVKAAEGILRAIESKSVLDLAKSLHEYMTICLEMDHEGEEYES